MHRRLPTPFSCVVINHLPTMYVIYDEESWDYLGCAHEEQEAYAIAEESGVSHYLVIHES